MNKAEVRLILASATSMQSSGLDGELGYNGLVCWRLDWPTAELEGNFTADQLEAIALWMRENADRE